jgi:hypothetical protein
MASPKKADNLSCMVDPQEAVFNILRSWDRRMLLTDVVPVFGLSVEKQLQLSKLLRIAYAFFVAQRASQALINSSPEHCYASYQSA